MPTADQSAAVTGGSVPQLEDFSAERVTWNQELYETEVDREIEPEGSQDARRTANELKRTQRTRTLLWMAVVLLIVTNVASPIYLVTVLSKHEKVALMDGTETMVITGLLPIEEAHNIQEEISYWAAKALLDRNPAGFDAPETLDRVFGNDALERAKKEWKSVQEEYAAKQIHQKFEASYVKLQRINDDVIVSHVAGQVIVDGNLGDDKISEPAPVTVSLRLVRNPRIGQNRRYPYMVADYSYEKAENLSATKQSQ
jgi:hypothetical protein